MTVIIKEEIIDGNDIYIAQDKFETTYKVGLAIQCEDIYRIIDERIYPTLDKAKRRYNDIKRKVVNV